MEKIIKRRQVIVAIVPGKVSPIPYELETLCQELDKYCSDKVKAFLQNKVQSMVLSGKSNNEIMKKCNISKSEINIIRNKVTNNQ